MGKTKKLVAVLFGIILAVSGCGADDVTDQVANIAQAEDEHVLSVKNARNSSYPDVTYGEAFEHYFEMPAWKYFEGTQEGPDDDGDGKPDYEQKNVDVVEFTGRCMYMDVKVKAKIQFALDEDTFEPVYLSFNDVPQSQLILGILLQSVFEESGGEENAKEQEEADDEPEKEKETTEKNDDESGEDEQSEDTTAEEMPVWSGETEGYTDILMDTAVNSESCEYAYYDINGDKRPEMIIGYGSCEADWINEVYTTDAAGNVMSAGHFGTLCNLYRAEDGNGIFAMYGHMGNETVTRITLKNNSLVTEKMWEKDIGINDYYSNGYPIEMTPYRESDFVQNTGSDYILPHSQNSHITEADLAGLSKDECRIARNEIYARHGRLFSDAQLQSYFNSKPWYNGYWSPEDFSDGLLSQVEKDNLDVIAQYETKMGWR